MIWLSLKKLALPYDITTNIVVNSKATPNTVIVLTEVNNTFMFI